jgi:hypothetical protein
MLGNEAEIEVRFSGQEAIILLKAIALAKHRGAGSGESDELEMLRCRIYGELYGDRAGQTGAVRSIFSMTRSRVVSAGDDLPMAA